MGVTDINFVDIRGEIVREKTTFYSISILWLGEECDHDLEDFMSFEST